MRKPHAVNKNTLAKRAFLGWSGKFSESEILRAAEFDDLIGAELDVEKEYGRFTRYDEKYD